LPEKMKNCLFKYILATFTPLIAGAILYMNCSAKPQKNSDSESKSSTGSAVHVEDTSLPTPEDVTEYWTPERMRDAKPMPFPDAVIPQDGRPPDSDNNATTEAMPGTAPGNLPDHQPEEETPDEK
jgi:hypothetical protein